MPRLAGDIPYRLLGGGQPTQSCNRSNSFLANPQSKDHHNASMFFDGTTDSAVIFGSAALHIDNFWTHMIWCAPAQLDPESEQTIYSIGTLNGGLTNSIDITIEASGVLAVSIFNSGGVLIQKKTITTEDTDTPGVDGFFFGNSWHQIVITWDSATLTVYRNGLNMNPYMTNITDIGGSQTETVRSITAGNHHDPFQSDKFEGFIHSHAHWSVALGQAEISTIYNAGSGTDVDLNLGHGGYVNNTELQSWYKYGVIPGSTVHVDLAPTDIPDIISTQSSEKARRSAPEGSFYTKDDAGTIGETNNTLEVANAHTVAAWVKPTSLPAEGVTRDVWRVTNGVTNFDQIALSLTTTGGVSYWEYEFSNAAGAYNVLLGTTPVVVDQWYHILGCKQDTASARFFVNGLDDLPPVIGGIVAQTNIARSTHFGYDGRGFNSDQFDGDIHSVAVWSVPVSENSVKAIYSGGWNNLDLRVEHPCYGEAPSLKQWWVLGDPSASASHPAGDTQFPNRAAGGFTLFTGMSGVGAEMRNRGIIETSIIGNCASFDDTSGLATATALPLGFADRVTISAWIKPDDLSSGIQYPLFIGPAQINLSANEITWWIDADDVQKPLIIQVTGSTGTVLQRVRFDNLLVEGEWQHITMVWDNIQFGGDIQTYYNGGLVAPVVDTTNAGSMADSSRFIELGGSDHVLAASAGLAFTGKISHVGMWDVNLGPFEIRTIATQSHGIDLRYNKDQYIQAESFQHYYKLGEDTFLKGRDFMNTMRGTNVSPMTVENGTVTIAGDAPGSEVEVAVTPSSIFSLAFNGTDEYMTGTIAKNLGSVDAFSIMGWIKYDISAGTTFDTLWRATAAGNLIAIQTKTPILAQLNGRIQINLTLPGGFEFKDMDWFDVIPDNEWVHFVFTYDGAVGGDPVTLYIDGVNQGVADAIGKDNAGDQDNTIVRLVEIGGTAAFGGTEWPGINYQMAMWSNALTSAEVTAIYDCGAPEFDLLTNTTHYVSSATLLHWWDLGQNEFNIGEDLGNHSTLIDLSGVNMDVSNRVADSPTGDVFTPSSVSVSFTEADQYLESTFAEDIGIANEWSFSTWWKPVSSTTQAIMDIGPEFGTKFNRISLSQRTSTHIGFDLTLLDLAGDVKIQYIILKNPMAAQWYNITWTWDGTTLLPYLDGVLQTTGGGTLVKNVDTPMTQTDSTRRFILTDTSFQSANGIGSMFSLGVWNTVLAPAEITAIVNGGDAAPVDLNCIFGDYVSSSNLQHYFRLGFAPLDIGKDYSVISPRDLESGGSDVVDADDIVIDVPEGTPIVFNPQLVSVDFNGFNESLSNRTGNPLGIVNSWTAAIWIKPQLITTNAQILHWRPNPGGNSITLWSRGADSAGRIQWENSQENGLTIKRFEWNAELVQDAWEFHVVTWNGTDLVAYKNGVNLGAPDIVAVDLTGTMTEDGDRWVGFGAGISGFNEMNCLLHSSMAWDVVLSSSAILGVYNGGNGSGFNPQVNSGNYVSNANLQHWWRFGADSGDIGADSGVAATLIDVMEDAENISAADIVADSPV